MRNLIIILLFCGIHVLNATVCNNPLKSRFNFTGPANSAVVSGLTVCKSLQNKETCCDLASFNSIQTKVNTMLGTLRDAAAARDSEISNVRQKILPDLSNSITRINTVMGNTTNSTFNFTNLVTGMKTAIMTSLNRLNVSNFDNLVNIDFTYITLPSNLANVSVNGLAAALIVPDNVTSVVNRVLQGLQSIASKMPNLKDNFMAYQKTRTKCVISMVKFQAAAWCLACDADYTAKGVDNSGNVNLSATLKNRLQTACYDYFAGTEEQSRLLELENEKDTVANMANVMEKLQNFDMTVSTQMQSLRNGMLQLGVPTENHKKPAMKPANCTNTSCPFIYETIVQNLQINTDMLGNGGTFTDSIASAGARLLEEDFGGRVLQTSTSWEVDEDEAGVTVTFSDDPANANSSTSGASLIKGTLATFAVLLMTLLF